MAETKEKKSHGLITDFGDVLLILLVVFVLWSALAGSFTSVGDFLNRLNPFSNETLSVLPLISSPIGSKVEAKGNTPVFFEPGGQVVGYQNKGATGSVSGGPILGPDGNRYWRVDFEDGSSGWVSEDDLTAAGGEPFNPGDTLIGKTLPTLSKTNIYSEPGSGLKGTVPAGTRGVVIDGPKVGPDGKNYYKVKYANGLEGWVPEEAIVDGLAGSGGSLSGSADDGNDLVGSRAQSIDGAAVYDKPGGKKIGISNRKSGVIEKGPVQATDGQRYYLVKFNDGTEGWVVEKELLGENGTPLDPGNTPIGRLVASKGAVSVFSEPGKGILGKQPDNSPGFISDGPILGKDGKPYWSIDFADGTDGWVAEDGLAFVPSKFGFGDKVLNKNKIRIYGSPNGEVIGSQNADAKGVITDGPRYANKDAWYFIDYESGIDGWVWESALVPDTTFNGLRFKVKSILTSLSTIVSLFLLTCIVYTLIRIVQISLVHYHKIKIEETKIKIGREVSHPRWEKVREHLSSDNPNDWRLAVMEADIILEEMLEKMGYVKGETIGDKLKTIEKSDFTSLDQAWEAHKIRNMIAHEGTDYILTEREAKRVVGLYEQVFKEFRYI